MKKNEPANKPDTEKKGRVIQKKSAHEQTLLGCGRRPPFDKINVEDSPDSLTSILTTPDLSNPVNAPQKEEMIEQLHETYGNSYLQAKLKIGQPNDKYEQEADRIADQVMRMPEKKESLVRKEVEPVQAKPLADRITPVIQANHASEQSPSVTPHIESRIDALEGGGQPLSESARSFFEPRFGTDFSQVRVHTDSHAANTAKSINAKAFTTGKDIAFGSNQYSPGTSTGKKLLAHELTHVVQQKSDGHIMCVKPLIQKEQDGQQLSKREEFQKILKSYGLPTEIALKEMTDFKFNSKKGFFIIYLDNEVERKMESEKEDEADTIISLGPEISGKIADKKIIFREGVKAKEEGGKSEINIKVLKVEGDEIIFTYFILLAPIDIRVPIKDFKNYFN